jgi:F-type H+-transporting ATPase subunit b
MLASSNFLVPNGTFIVELVAFLAVLGALAKWVLPVLQKAMSDRQQTLADALANAEQAKLRAEEAEAEYRRVIDEARAEARHLVDEANRLADRQRADKQERANQEYESILGRARDDIQAEARQAAADLRQQIADLAIAVAEKVIGEGLEASTHRGIVDRAIAELEADSGAAGVSH